MIKLGDSQYGKAKIRVLRVDRGGTADDITDLNVSITLRGDFETCYTDGDNSAVLTTDAQKNTVFAFADRYGVGSVETFAERLATHFVSAVPAVEAGRVTIERYPWDRVAGHSFARSGSYVRTTTVTSDSHGVTVESGLRGLTLLNTAGSEFRGFLRDEFTMLAETSDRIMATDADARWHYGGPVESLPNKHHFEQSSHDVYYASDRPYGLIEGTVVRD